jgi:hypothetical protein
MKKLLGLVGCICLCSMLLFGTTGCPKKEPDKKVTTTDTKKVTETKTDKGTTQTTEEKTVTEEKDKKKKTTTEEKKLTVKAPADTSVTQGETATINVDITREKFTDSVDLKFAGLPDGVTVLEKDLTIAKDASSAKVTLKAAADAKPVDDQKVTVTASGGGMTPDATFKVTVKKKAAEKKPTTDDKKPTTDDKKPTTDDKKPTTDDKKPKADDKKPATDDKKPSSSLSSQALDFYALLNDRFLTPVYAVRSLQVAYHTARNEPRVTA